MDDNRSLALPASSPAIILVEPQMGENIGMAARAMANFGLSELRIVAPRDGWPNEKAMATASRATSVVENAVVYDDLRTALADLNFVFATTARERDGYKPVRGPVDAAAALRSRGRAGEKTGIMFGREKYGLDNEQIALADEIVTFPVNPEFASLNIAQAVLLMSYEWMKTGLARDTDIPFYGPETEPAPKEELHGYFEHLESALSARGYFRPAAKKAKMVDKIRAVLTRPAFTTGELRVLRGVLASLDYFSPNEPRGAGYPRRKADVDRKAHPEAMQRRPATPKETPADE